MFKLPDDTIGTAPQEEEGPKPKLIPRKALYGRRIKHNVGHKGKKDKNGIRTPGSKRPASIRSIWENTILPRCLRGTIVEAPYPTCLIFHANLKTIPTHWGYYSPRQIAFAHAYGKELHKGWTVVNQCGHKKCVEPTHQKEQRRNQMPIDTPIKLEKIADLNLNLPADHIPAKKTERTPREAFDDSVLPQCRIDEKCLIYEGKQNVFWTGEGHFGPARLARMIGLQACVKPGCIGHIK